MTYEVRLDVFEGPLDLLLQLVSRKRVDIYDVSLATITEEYLAAVRRLADPDLESTTGFLVVAATLLELKSARLLPAGEADAGEQGLLEERDLLLARLVEVATYREAGSWIRVGLDRGDLVFTREAPLEPHLALIAPDPLEHLSIADVAAAAASILTPHPPVDLDTSHVTPITASVGGAIVELWGSLSQAGTRSFSELCAGLDDRMEVIVRFLALLELHKAGAVELAQLHRFGDIRATLSGDVDAYEIALGAEDYESSDSSSSQSSAGGAPRARKGGTA